MDKLICKGEIYYCITVNTLVKKSLAAVEIDISAVVIQHRGYTIEAVAVEVVLLQPILHIREQEVLNLALAIVKYFRVPILLIARIARL